MTCACGQTHRSVIADVQGGRVALGIAEVGKPTKSGKIMSESELKSELETFADLAWDEALRWAAAVVAAAKIASTQAGVSAAQFELTAKGALAGRLRS